MSRKIVSVVTIVFHDYSMGQFVVRHEDGAQFSKALRENADLCAMCAKKFVRNFSIAWGDAGIIRLNPEELSNILGISVGKEMARTKISNIKMEDFITTIGDLAPYEAHADVVPLGHTRESWAIARGG